MNKPFLTLQQALIIPFVLLTSSLVLTTGYFTWKYTEESILELGTQLSKRSGVDAQEKIKNMLESSYAINLVIKETLLNNFIKKNERTKLSNYIKNIVIEQQKKDFVGFGFPDGTYVGYSYLADGSLQQGVSSLDANRTYRTYKITKDEFNKEIKTELSNKKSYDARLRPWFQEATKSSTPIWSSIFEMFDSNDFGITLSEAAYNKQGEFLGVIGTDLVFRDLAEKLHSIKLTPNSVIFITDNKENLIAHNLDINKTQYKLTKVHESSYKLIKESYKAITQTDMLGSKTNIDSTKLSIEDQVEQYFIHFSPYIYNESLGWNIGVVIPEKDFLGYANKIKSYTAFILIGSLLVSLMLGILVTLFISKSIRHLQNSVTNVENTNKLDLNKYKIKEVYDLASAFFELSERVKKTLKALEQSKATLEDTVLIRTQELKEVNQRLLHLSHTDNLTQIPNRRYFEEVLDDELNNLKKLSINNLALLMCDIDFFKQYNDTYGHQAGDECLEIVATVMKHSIRKSDTVARYGGEEFVIILPGANEKVAQRVAHHVIKRLAEKNIPHSSSKILPRVSISIGIAVINSETQLEKSDIIGHADKALYWAKAQGRNQYQEYSKYLDSLI